MTGVTLDASPQSLLGSLRGSVVDARLAYPDVLQVEIRDPGGGMWVLATQDAEWAPRDPSRLRGREVLGVKLDRESWRLTLALRDSEPLEITPASVGEEAGAPPTWELLTPDGLAVQFGPGLRWQISAAG